MPVSIQELIVYPIKSLRGCSLSTTDVGPRGLRHDRRWMLVDDEGQFLSQRSKISMALIDTRITSHGIEVSVGGRDPLLIPFEPAGRPATVEVWKTPCDAIEVGGDSESWFSEALGVSCRLYYMPETSVRPVVAPGARDGDWVGFADNSPILFASQESIDDLNSRLPSPIPIRRFRPNVVVKGCEAFGEDHWDSIRIGEVPLHKTNRCGRCLVTTIDIETATTSEEPLRTLAHYRKDGSNVWFGCYYAPERAGRFAVGDEVALT